MYRLENVSFTYSQIAGTGEPSPWFSSPCLLDINLEINRGERLVIIGPSGCGKSTLLLLLAGLLPPTRGQIRLGDRALSGPRPEISLILQDCGLLPWKTVYDNAALGLTIRSLKKDRIRERILPLLSFLGLKEHLGKYPSQLSGGQRQRVAFARSLATQPEYLLLDEPFSALDALTREMLQDNLLDLANSYGFTLILVTHNIEEAVYLGEKIAIFSPSPARLLWILDNRSARQPDRNSPGFYRQCARVRSLLEGGQV